MRLRESATIDGDVDVIGQYNWLDVWNHERFVSKLQREPYTDDDARALALVQQVLAVDPVHPRALRFATQALEAQGNAAGLAVPLRPDGARRRRAFR